LRNIYGEGHILDPIFEEGLELSFISGKSIGKEVG